MRDDGAARTGGEFGREKANAVSGDARMLASRQPVLPGTEMTDHGKAAYEKEDGQVSLAADRGIP
ncbi:hypothetical protein FU139_16985 [Burkholderia territorii]|nr:hypothetical protein FU139_16985 [Burkholderia territorii]